MPDLTASGPCIPVPPAGDGDWRWRAACRGVQTEKFYADSSAHVALAYCRPCPVRAECLTWALTAREPGVWGGTTERRRSGLLLAAASHVPTALALARREWAGGAS